jgi:hypothetical protein
MIGMTGSIHCTNFNMIYVDWRGKWESLFLLPLTELLVWILRDSAFMFYSPIVNLHEKLSIIQWIWSPTLPYNSQQKLVVATSGSYYKFIANTVIVKLPG